MLDQARATAAYARRFADAVAALLAITSVASAIFAVLWLLAGERGGFRPWIAWASVADTQVLTSFTEASVGVLGIAITVVAIIVELAANRYTPRVSELFVRDPVNGAVLSFFVLSVLLSVWIDLTLASAARPGVLVLAATAFTTGSVVLILPYFAYVFDFLSPTQVIDRIRDAGAGEFKRLRRRGEPVIPSARAELLRAIEQLGDIALNSVDKKDKPLAFASLTALAEIAEAGIRSKARMPPAWFDTAPLVAGDQDFIALHPDMVHALTARQTWVEMKIFRQYQSVFGDAVNRMRDVNHLAAIHTRRLAGVAVEVGDPNGVQISVRFLNTYMRAAVNAHDVRTAYNLLNEYRELAEYALGRGQGALAIELAERMRFYGQLAFGAQLGFVLESAAYDLCQLLELAHATRAPEHDRLLAIFLELDREPEARSMEASLRGVRKAQIKLATYYLSKGEEKLARRICHDMRGEPPARLASIKAELQSVIDAEFWEVSDRGINFEWLAPERRAHLETFYRWLNEGSGLTAPPKL
jgi:hypothetical protein